jgi:3-oxoacyl-[acyl-carrier protein] reductase
VTVNAIAPGFIDTDMIRALNEKQIESLLLQIPLARFGKPEEIASVAGFLASDAGGYITGETIQVNGGMYMA